jgi:hypothetical protein
VLAVFCYTSELRGADKDYNNPGTEDQAVESETQEHNAKFTTLLLENLACNLSIVFQLGLRVP